MLCRWLPCSTQVCRSRSPQVQALRFDLGWFQAAGSTAGPATIAGSLPTSLQRSFWLRGFRFLADTMWRTDRRPEHDPSLRHRPNSPGLCSVPTRTGEGAGMLCEQACLGNYWVSTLATAAGLGAAPHAAQCSCSCACMQCCRLQRARGTEQRASCSCPHGARPSRGNVCHSFAPGLRAPSARRCRWARWTARP